MIDNPVIDSHIHLWDMNYLQYPWLADLPKLQKSFLTGDYENACGGIPVEKMVFIQCECDPSQYFDEVQWVNKLADDSSKLQGIVAWAPLEKGGAVEEKLEKLSSFNRVKGIRRIIQYEDDLEFCLKSGFIAGVNLLSKYQMSFDICISHIHLENAIKMVEQCPKVQFVLDHIAKPNIKDQNMDPWRNNIKKLASFQNVFCKISGFVTEADLEHWKKDDLQPYFNHVLESFGPQRLMFGSDWPVVTLASSYQRWVETLLEMMAELSKNEQKLILYDNALKFYRL